MRGYVAWLQINITNHDFIENDINGSYYNDANVSLTVI